MDIDRFPINLSLVLRAYTRRRISREGSERKARTLDGKVAEISLREFQLAGIIVNGLIA